MHKDGIWDKDIQTVKGIGPKRVGLFKKLGIHSVGDLLYYFPRNYEDRTSVNTDVFDPGTMATVVGEVLGGEIKRPRRGLTITRIFIKQDTGRMVAVWYNQPFIKRQFPVGARASLTGKLVKYQNEIQILVSDYEIGKNSLLHTGPIVPVYPLTEGLHQRLVRSVIKSAVLTWSEIAEEFIPDSILTKYRLPRIGSALQSIHQPKSALELRMAQRRFIFEDFFLHQVLIFSIRKKARLQKKVYAYPKSSHLEKQFLKSLPFTLTSGQTKAWKEINEDMNVVAPMNRLLQGDVGSGKTVLCALAMLKAVSGGFQSALMAPTEILAGQHYLTIVQWFKPMGISVALLTGGMNKKNRQEILHQIKAGAVQVVIGTHALIQEDVEFKQLVLAVIDEQHRFGVRQRAWIGRKGSNPDILVMTATPIPRTLAMTLYGDMDISFIRGLPPGRKPVKTVICSHSQENDVYRQIKKEIIAGRQGYVVCPLIEESEKVDLQAVVELKEFLEKGPLMGCQIALLHGRMKAEEKEGVMSHFRRGMVDVLISTTVVEVGVDVPNASFMVVVNAERFGLSQLHQLRCRVGRGMHSATCYLISDAVSEASALRLEAMKSINDGFELAEKDLELRGPGELFGTKQWGELFFRMADPVRDGGALKAAAEEARHIIERDPSLEKPEHNPLLNEMKSRLKGLDLLTVG